MADLTPLKRSYTDMANSDDQQAAVAPEAASTFDPMDFIPRSYQMKVFEVAMKRNTIAVLETGAGKTMIAVMLIKEISRNIKSSGHKKLILFLAPTVHLVNQQYEVIKKHTNLDVGEYYGAKGVDEWTLEFWKKEIDDHDVFVMTPQILLDVLRKAFLNPEILCLMIIDECHRATGNHPYTRIMKEFYHKLTNKPKIFGMTASPVVSKGVSSAMDCENQISKLENILDSQIYAIEDRIEMDIHIPSARETCRFYDKGQLYSSEVKSKIEALWSKFDASLLSSQKSAQGCYKDLDDKIKTLRQQLSNDHSKILNCLDDLGLICAYEAVKVCLQNAPTSIEECEIYREISSKCKSFLEEVLSVFSEYLSHVDDSFFPLGFDYLEAVGLGYISPKLHELLQVFLSFGGAMEILCLIFVDRILTAKVIERFVKKVAAIAHFTVSYVTGTNSSVDALKPKTQKETLESFRSGKVNLLFSTDVLREGIHVPNCSFVICFDLPKTVSCYVQSRGRARQNDSHYIIMLERGNMKQRDQLFDCIRSEWLLNNTALDRDPDLWTPKACFAEETKAYIVDKTGASVTADCSVSLIHQYCGKLPRDKYFTPMPKFEFEFSEKLCQCKLKLPASAAFQTIVGPECRSQQLAKKLVCLEACKMLHQKGALDDHLLPLVTEPAEDDHILQSKETSAGAGTTKRKELHGTTNIHALSGSWGEKLDTVTFYAYRFDFSCSIPSQIYSGFIILLESKLDDDVGNFELELYLLRKTVKTSVVSCGQVNLDGEQVMKAKCFHELFFNALFGKLFTGSKSSDKPREFLLQKKKSELWVPSNMYLLLPLETFNGLSDDSWKINWTGVNACTYAVEFLKNSLMGAENYNNAMVSSSPLRVGSSATECSDTTAIQFANILIDANKVEDMVVLAIHTGKIYSVVKVANDTSAESPFEQSFNGRPTKYSSFANYFNQKYGIVLKYPGQPLLLLKQSHKPHNLLLTPDKEGAPKDGSDVEKQRQYAQIPPELLVSIDIPVQTLKSFYLFPSLMNRLESLMLASQLRQEIGCCFPNFHIPSSLMLDAITSLRCNEAFSMERLELLGDSVLKYAIGLNLFLKHPTKHEGQLSTRRMQIICNSTLHKFGTSRKLQGYIRDSAFEPRCWVAPGQRPVYHVPCECGIDTSEVPLDCKFQTKNQVVIGKCCSKGHRWMCSKTISDCVEAIIGAYYVCGGLTSAIHVMKWFGVDVEFDVSWVNEAIKNASQQSCIPNENDVNTLETKLGHAFSTKFLLQEAITHASMQEQGITYSYERLEFLGDSALDLLITWHLYQSHTNIDPGELTDLRSACVNNDNFAQVVVRKDLYKHLRHSSTLLQSHIEEYLQSFHESDGAPKSTPGLKAPKVLGDLLESICGAILIDTKLNLHEVWRIFEPLLSPLATPESLELCPRRELIELCDFHGYFVKEICVTKDDNVHAKLRLQLKDELLVGDGHDRNIRSAKAKAAAFLLKELQKRGMTHLRGDAKRRKQAEEIRNNTSFVDRTNECTTEPPNKQRKLEIQLPAGSSRDPSIGGSAPHVVKLIDTKKGQPRMSLFELCKKAQWIMPTFNVTEYKFSTRKLSDDSNKKPQTNINFVAKVTLNIPSYGIIECEGEPRPDKKSSCDSAAITILHQLQELGHVILSVD